VASSWSQVAAAAEYAAHAGRNSEPLAFLSAPEAADLDAITAQILPSGPTPGAREAHVVHFIDRALATFFAERAAAFRSGLVEFQQAFRIATGAPALFAQAASGEQIAFLTAVERTEFFGTLRLLTILGTLSSSDYGGNFREAGWRLLGFEDQHAFLPPFGDYDRQYSGFVAERAA
jgi:hypothetical protein